MKTTIKIATIVIMGMSLGMKAQDEVVNGKLTTKGDIKISDLRTSLGVNDIIGKLEFYKSDVSTGGIGVPTYIQSRAYDLGGLFEMDFITGSVKSPVNTMTLGRYGLDLKGASESIKISDLRTSLGVNDIIGKLEFYKSDVSTGGVGVPTYIQSRAYDLGGLFEMDFITGSVKSPVNTMTLGGTGNVGIGTTTPDMKLTVNGNIHAKEVKIDLNIPAPDYVFRDNYELRSIEEVESFIKKYSHLPEIPSAKEFAKNGVMLTEMNMNLLKKVEELTLYTIQQEKEIRELKKEKIKNEKQQKEIEELRALVQKLLKNKN